MIYATLYMKKCTLIQGKIAYSCLWKLYSYLFIPNCTRNQVFTYTTFPDLSNTLLFRALLIPSFLQFLLWISAYLRYLSIFSEGKPYPCRPKFLTWEADVFTTWLKKGKVNSFTIVTLSGIITRRAGQNGDFDGRVGWRESELIQTYLYPRT